MQTKITDLLTHGSKTRRINALIEEMCDELDRLPTYREVAERYASEGGNENTARTQYAHWKRMQQVNPASEPASESASESGDAANPRRPVTPFEHDAPADIGPVALNIDGHGRLSLPGELCAAMCLGPDGRVTARIEGGELRIIAPRVAIRRAQTIVRKHVKPGVSMVDEFLAERRTMWGDE